MKVVAPVAEKTTAEAGGHFLARGKPVSLSGEPPRGRLVIVQFENMDQLHKWWNNPEWQAAHNKGEQYAKFRDMAIEGVSPKVAECRRLQRPQATFSPRIFLTLESAAPKVRDSRVVGLARRTARRAAPRRRRSRTPLDVHQTSIKRPLVTDDVALVYLNESGRAMNHPHFAHVHVAVCFIRVGPGLAGGLIAGAVIGGIASSAYAYGPGYGYYGGPGYGYYGGHAPVYYGGCAPAYSYGYAPAYYGGYPGYYGSRYRRVVRPAYGYGYRW